MNINKERTEMASVLLLWEEGDALEAMAKKTGLSKSGVLRTAFHNLVKTLDPKLAKEIFNARIRHAVQAQKSAKALAFKAAIRTRNAAPQVLMFFFAFTIPLLSEQGVEMRRPRRVGMAYRVSAHTVRKQEIAA